MKRNAFTLIEMMVSISILAMMLLFLYKSYADMHQANDIYKTKSFQASSLFTKKKTIFLDFTLADATTITIIPIDPKSDFVYFQTSHSLYGNLDPYVAYIKREEELYRIESLQSFEGYPIPSNVTYSNAESLGKIQIFRLYKKASDANANSDDAYLLHTRFETNEEILYKLKPLNESIN